MDPLTIFAATRAKEEQIDIQKKMDQYVNVLSRIGATASDFFADSVSFGESLASASTSGKGFPASAANSAYQQVQQVPATGTSAPLRQAANDPSTSFGYKEETKDYLERRGLLQQDSSSNITATESPRSATSPTCTSRNADSFPLLPNTDDESEQLLSLLPSQQQHARPPPYYTNAAPPGDEQRQQGAKHHQRGGQQSQQQSVQHRAINHYQTTTTTNAQQQQQQSKVDDDVSSINIPLLVGEQKVLVINDAFIHLTPSRYIGGVFVVTTYRLAFVPSQSHMASLISQNPSIYTYLNLPLGCIEKIEKERRVGPRTTTSTTLTAAASTLGPTVTQGVSSSISITVVITCKDVRQHRITFQGSSISEYNVDRALATLSAYAFPNDPALLFAFSHSLPSEPLDLTLVPPYDAVTEFSRQGILDVLAANGDQSLWQISHVNFRYRLCNTYPEILVMPRRLTDEDLFVIANFRSGHRLPTLCWGDRDSGATMWRASQPKAGVSGSCSLDEKMLDIIAYSCVYKKTPTGQVKTVSDPILHIIDCRPKSSAMANRATGAGYESQTNYPNTRIEFCNIGNIHVMRDSYRSLAAIFMSPIPASNDVNFSKQIEDTQWLTHVRLVLKCAHDTASLILKGIPVLVHCSHGWDRTAQVCALSQLLLDPYYRTLEGFKVLVEKEWISFGHQFQLRCGHGQDRSNRQEDQLSPIFLQFVDCVWQLVKQFPHYFEFNVRYLLALGDHLHSCRFGTFLFGSDMERERFKDRHPCVDIWTYLHYNRAALSNPMYLDPNKEDTPTTHTLLPPLTQLLRNVTIWMDYYGRWAALPTMLSIPEPLASFINDNTISHASCSLIDSNSHATKDSCCSISSSGGRNIGNQERTSAPPTIIFAPFVGHYPITTTSILSHYHPTTTGNTTTGGGGGGGGSIPTISASAGSAGVPIATTSTTAATCTSGGTTGTVLPSPSSLVSVPGGVVPGAVGGLGGVRCFDLELPAMATSDDFWEAAYRMERRAREALQLEIINNAAQSDGSGGGSGGYSNDSNSGCSVTVAGAAGHGGGGGGDGGDGTGGGRWFNDRAAPYPSVTTTSSKDVMLKKQQAAIELMLQMLRNRGVSEEDIDAALSVLHVGEGYVEDDDEDHGNDDIREQQQQEQDEHTRLITTTTGRSISISNRSISRNRSSDQLVHPPTFPASNDGASHQHHLLNKQQQQASSSSSSSGASLAAVVTTATTYMNENVDYSSNVGPEKYSTTVTTDYVSTDRHTSPSTDRHTQHNTGGTVSPTSTSSVEILGRNVDEFYCNPALSGSAVSTRSIDSSYSSSTTSFTAATASTTTSNRNLVGGEDETAVSASPNPRVVLLTSSFAPSHICSGHTGAFY